MVAFISADGKSIPPVFIFHRKKLKPEMHNYGPVGCLGLCHQSGLCFLINHRLFHQFINYNFINYLGWMTGEFF